MTDDILDIELSSVLKVGEVFSQKFLVEEQLGYGGMGCVYRATDTSSKKSRKVALKVLHPTLLSDEQARLRFIREAKALKSLLHRNIVQVYDFAISQSGLLYLEMEYLEGPTLAEVIVKQGPLSISRFISIFSQVLASLSYAHDEGFIHRDLKPGNIMLVRSAAGAEKVKLVDFGVAKLVIDNDSGSQELTDMGEFIGSPSYMSPEQIEGDVVDVRSDIYSLGCVMYEAVTGIRAFTGRSSFVIMHKQVRQDPQSFLKVCQERGIERDIPAWLERIIFKALAKHPENRYANCHELRLALLDSQFSKPKVDAPAEHFRVLPWESLETDSSDKAFNETASGMFDVLPQSAVGQITEQMRRAGTISLGSTTRPPELRSFSWLVLQLLRNAEVVTDLELSAAREYQKANGGDLGRILVARGLVDSTVFSSAMKAQRMVELGQLTEERAILVIRDCQRQQMHIDR